MSLSDYGRDQVRRAKTDQDLSDDQIIDNVTPKTLEKAYPYQTMMYKVTNPNNWVNMIKNSNHYDILDKHRKGVTGFAAPLNISGGIGPVAPVPGSGTSTSGRPNDQGNGKSNTKKQQPKQPNSIFEKLKDGLNNAQANLNNAYLNEVSQFKSNPGLYLGTRAAGIGGFMPGAVGTGLAAAESYGNTLLNGGSKQDAIKNAQGPT